MILLMMSVTSQQVVMSCCITLVWCHVVSHWRCQKHHIMLWCQWHHSMTLNFHDAPDITKSRLSWHHNLLPQKHYISQQNPIQFYPLLLIHYFWLPPNDNPMTYCGCLTPAFTLFFYPFFLFHDNYINRFPSICFPTETKSIHGWIDNTLTTPLVR